jgi:signal peptidase II
MAIVLFGLAVLSVAVMLAFKEKLAPRSHLTSIILPLFIGGSLGNFIDRLARGAVVDWINCSFFTGPFNIADIAILSAISFFVAGILNGERKKINA